jgi:DNA recombination protein RmuC
METRMELVLWLLAVLAAVQFLLLLAVWRRQTAPRPNGEADARLVQLLADIERVERGVREEHRAGRSEAQAAFAGFDQRLAQFTDKTQEGLTSLRQVLAEDARASRHESSAGLQRFEAALQSRLEKLNETTERRLGEVRQTLEARLKELQLDNAAKLEQMRQTVDEKLQSTLEARLGESFRMVQEQLERVQIGLGEMQSLATGVGDLKRVLGNVKTRGVFGEVALAAILEQILTVEQYAANVATAPGSNERVEFAIRLPGQGDAMDSPVWLPIDAKFPREDYERLLDAQENADLEGAIQAGAALERRMREEARSISLKYVAPPHTSDFAIMFLPTEGLYAEVLRRPGLVELLQRDHRVVIAGPTTLSAILNSLRMGFRTLAIEKRSSEVWQVLGAVRTEFGKFGQVLEKVRKQIGNVSNTLDDTSRRSRAIERKLRGVEAATDADTRLLLGDAISRMEAEADKESESENENGAE